MIEDMVAHHVNLFSHPIISDIQGMYSHLAPPELLE